MGSKALDGGRLVVAFGGPLPGCRVLLLSDPAPGIAEALGVELARVGWRRAPEVAATHGVLERRAFVRRDRQGQAYLMNVITIADPGSKLRLFTTTIRIPAGVALPVGF